MFRLLSLTLGLLVVGCSSHDRAAVTSTGPRASALAAKCAPARRTETVIVAQSLRRGVLTRDGGEVKWGEDSYVCGAARDLNPEGLPEVAMLVGELDGASNSTLFRLVRNLSDAAAASGRLGCVYVLSPANLRRLAEHPNLDRVVILGRGTNGNLISFFTRVVIQPEQLLPFQSERIRGVHAFATNLKPKLGAWHHVFNHSPEALFDLNDDSSTTSRSLLSVEDLFDNLWTCKL